MKKRTGLIGTALLALCLVVGVLPAPARAASDTHSHNLMNDGSGDEPITFEEWTDTDSLPGASNLTDRAGSFYLSGDVELSGTWTVPADGTVNLCLNGYQLSRKDSNPKVISVPTGATLNICDCSDKTDENTPTHNIECRTDDNGGTKFVEIKGGLIKGAIFDENTSLSAVEVNGGTCTLYGGTIAGTSNKIQHTAAGGGGVYVQNGGTFNMRGGEIRDNRAAQGAGVLVMTNGTFNMYGGKIHGNTGSWGGGVCVTKNNDGSGTMNLYGGEFEDNDGVKTGADDIYVDNGSSKLNLYGNTAFTVNIILESGTSGSNPHQVFYICEALAQGTSVKLYHMASIGSARPTSIKVAEGGTPSNGTGTYTITSDDAAKISSMANVHAGYHFALKSDVLYLERHSHAVDGGTTGTAVNFEPWPVTGAPDATGNYFLDRNVELSDTWIVTAGTVNVCLNGHKLSKASGNTVVQVDSDATLNICDCSDKTDPNTPRHSINDPRTAPYTQVEIAGGLIAGNITTGANTGGGVYVNGGTCTLYGGTIAGSGMKMSGGASGGGVGIENGGTFIMRGGAIQYNMASQGAGVRARTNGTFTMYGGSIEHNKGQWGGGASIEKNGIINLYGGTFNDNTVTAADEAVSGQPEDIYVPGGVGKLNLYGTNPNGTPGYQINVVLENNQKVYVCEALNADTSIKLYRKGVTDTSPTSAKVAEGANGYAITQDDADKIDRVVDTLYPNHQFLLKDDGLYLIIHQHNWSAWDGDSDNHWKNCTGEGTCDITDNNLKDSHGAHIWSTTEFGDDITNPDGHYQKCETCQYVETTQTTHGFTVSKITGDTVNHRKTCACGYSEDVPHGYGGYEDAGDGNHSRTCTDAACGYVESTAHTYTTRTSWTESTDPNKPGHYQQCDSCAHQNVVSHTPGTWQAQGDAGHTWTCTAEGCNYSPTAVAHTYGDYVKTGETEHWQECSLCHRHENTGTHDGNWEWKSSGNTGSDTHWQECSVCHRETNSGTHQWKTDAWETDGTDHWHKCTQDGCTARKDEAEHRYTDKANENNHWEECSVCKKIVNQASHEYDADDWETDGNNHWHVCTVCHEEVSKVAHSAADPDTWEQDTNGGVHYQVCEVCARRFGDEAHEVDTNTWVYHTDTPYDENDPNDTSKCRWHACSKCGWADPSTIEGHKFTVSGKDDEDTGKHWTACEDCDLKINEVPHTFNGPWLDDGNGRHYKKCDGCDYQGEKGTHDQNEKDFGADGHWPVCSVCNLKSGDEVEHDKDWSDESATGDTHWEKCADCNWTGTAEPHDYKFTSDNGDTHTLTCECGASKSENHTYGDFAPAADNEGKHVRTCTVEGCGHKDDQNHNYLNYGTYEYTDPNGGTNEAGTHSKTCTVCGDVKSGDHEYDETANWTTNPDRATGHYKTCTGCGHQWAARHELGSSWADNGDSGHYQTCQECGYTTQDEVHRYGDWVNTDSDQHWKVCSTCDYEGEKDGHNFAWKSDSGKHWQECTVCHAKKVETPHGWDEDAWTTDGTHHWHKCKQSGCTARKDEAEHRYTESDKDGTHHWKACECGEVLTRTAHTWGTDWVTNETSHWHACTGCGATKDVTGHSSSTWLWDEDPDASPTSQWHYKVCAGCGSQFDKGKHSTTKVLNPIPIDNNSEDQECSWEQCSCGWVDPSTITGHHFVDEQNEDGHWRECSGCNEKINQRGHDFSGGYSQSADGTKHYKQCTVKGCTATDQEEPHTYAAVWDKTGHWTVCVCGKTTSVVDHTMVYAADSKTNATGHWKVCTEKDCGWVDSEGVHIYTDVKTSAAQHWKVCACGAEGPKTGHTKETKWNGNDHWEVCTDTDFGCTWTSTEATHRYSNKYAYDAKQHWLVCDDCGHGEDGRAGHDYDDATQSCTTCGYQYVVVTFDSQGGSAVDFQRAPIDGKAVKPANPTRSGNTFGGWYTDEACTTAYDFDKTVTTNTTLYAKWNKSGGSGGNQGGGGRPSSGGTPSNPSTPSDPTPPSNPTTPTNPDTTTTVTKNPDGSTTTTVTDHNTGVVTETTPNMPNGNTVEKVTDANKDVTITVISSSGEQLARVELPAQVDTSARRFVDVPVGHWADQGIHEMAALGVINGVGDNRYSMSSSIKRGDLATMFCRMSNGKADTSALFEDVPTEKYYSASIAWSNKVGVVEGHGNGYFRPENAVTRQELAVMLYRYAVLLNMGGETRGSVLAAFTDGHRVSDWATDGVAWCVGNRIVEGKGGGLLDPTSNVTRAEAAVMLRRFLELAK